jgi:hypothetical protein
MVVIRILMLLITHSIVSVMFILLSFFFSILGSSSGKRDKNQKLSESYTSYSDHSHKVPRSMGTRDGVEERGRFCIVGTKMSPRSRVGDDVSGSRDSATDPVSGDYDSDGENQAGPLKSNIVKLSCKLSAYVDTCILYVPEIPNTWICLGIF